MSTYRIETSQIINADLNQVWDFISSPQNLKNITPKHMGFDIISPNLPQKMYQGMMIEYIVKPILGIKMNWLSEITHIKEYEFFVDEQRAGPYTLWHHQHHIAQTEKGVLMADIVHYIPPMSILGSLANFLFIKKQLKEIFDYRRLAIEKKFPSQ